MRALDESGRESRISFNEITVYGYTSIPSTKHRLIHTASTETHPLAYSEEPSSCFAVASAKVDFLASDTLGITAPASLPSG